MLMLGLSMSAWAQDDKSDKELFNEAEFFFMNEDYRTAAYFYKKALRVDTSNANFSYCLGLSYLKLPEKEKYAVAYLKRASKKLSDDYQPGVYEEKKASIEVFRYLAEAYMRIEKYELATVYLRKYIDKMGGGIDEESMSFIKSQIDACSRALEKDTASDKTIIVNLGDVINSESNESAFCVSYDDSVMVILREVPVKKGDLQERDAVEYKRKLYYAVREPEGWSIVEEISREVKLKSGAVPISISPDRKTILFYRDNEIYGDVAIDYGAIYYSYKKEKGWTGMKKLPGEVNSRWDETSASFSQTGDTLYFASDRDGGFGGLDLYYALKNKKGVWSEVVNMGDTVNTVFNEIAPVCVTNGLFFSSEGHKTFGGYDVFYIAGDVNNGWGTVTNVSAKLNSGFNEVGFIPVLNGIKGYIVLSGRSEFQGIGRADIYEVSEILLDK